eukprot:c20819_g2_i1 orf=545-2635(-)
MEDSAVETWVHTMVSDLAETMPNMTVHEMLTMLSGMLSPLNVQVEQVLDSLQLDHLHDPRFRPTRPCELLESPLQGSPQCANSPTVDALDKGLSKRPRIDGRPLHGMLTKQENNILELEALQCQRFQSMSENSHLVNGEHNTFDGYQSNFPIKGRKPSLEQEFKGTHVESAQWTSDYKAKEATKAAALSLSLDLCDNHMKDRGNYNAQVCELHVYNENQVLGGSNQGAQYAEFSRTTACMAPLQHQQQELMPNQHHQQQGIMSKHHQQHQEIVRRPRSAYTSMDEQQQEIMRQPALNAYKSMDDVSSDARNVASSAHMDLNPSDEEGLELLSLLLQCAEAVATDNLDAANSLIPLLNEMSSPYGNPIQRVAAYFTEGMAARILNSYLGICSPLPAMQRFCNQSISSAFQIFNGLCPYVKFSHFTANQAILEAFEGHQRVHIIDCDIMQGLQWPALFHILASRPEGPPCVRITGIGTSLEALEATGKRLSDFANTLGMPFEFHSVADRVGNLDLTALKVRQGDALAVHWLQHSLYDVTGSDSRTLQLFQQLKPTVLTIVEQDLSHGGTFVNRFIEALHYYSALFDSLGANHAEGSEERHAVEQQLLSSEMKNIVAVGGPARTGEVKFENWRDVMSSAGFRKVSLAGNAATQATLLLNMFPCEGYSLSEETGVLKLGWKDLSLFTASAWSLPTSHYRL